MLRWLAIAALAVATPTWAASPHARLLSADDGMVPGEAFAVTQDGRGIVWIGSLDGVSRWDGRRVLDADRGAIRTRVNQLVGHPDGGTWAVTDEEHLWRVDEHGAERFLGPSNAPIRAQTIAVDRHGRALVTTEGQLWRLRDGYWELLQEDPRFTQGQFLEVLSDDSVVFCSDAVVYLLDGGPAAPLRRLWTGAWRGEGFAEAPDGTLWIGDRTGQLAHVARDGEVLWSGRLQQRSTRVAEIVAADDAIWVGHSTAIFRKLGDGPFEQVGPSNRTTAGGDIHVDDEGSLWVATFDGVYQIPNPDVVRWTHEDGLVTDLTRSVDPVGDLVYVTSWTRPAVIDPATRSLSLIDGTDRAKARICGDDTGLAWTTRTEDGAAVIAIRERRIARQEPSTVRFSSIESCDTDAIGHVWLTAGTELIRAHGDEPLRRFELPVQDASIRAVYVERTGAVWIVVGTTICHSTIAELEGGVPGWRCEDLGTTMPSYSLHRSEAGRLFLSNEWGLRVRDEGTWREARGLESFPSLQMRAIAPASQGGFWIGGHGVLVRARDTPEGPDDVEILDDLSMWLGPQLGTVFDVAETPDGTLWVSHGGGVTEVPPTSQHPTFPPPPVSLLSARLDGVPIDTSPLVFGTADSVARLLFTAPSYRAPRLLRFRSRLDDRPWSAPTEDAVFDLQGLSPGAHTFAVAASLDGQTWTEAPATVTLLVPQPWYSRWELWVLVLAAAALAALVVQRVTASVSLQLERVRTRIALDLHDEIGASLGALRLLGSVLRRDLDPPAVRRVGEDIVETSEELSESLRGIVWSLRAQSQNLGELTDYLGDRARKALPSVHLDGQLVVEIAPGAEEVPVSLDVLRAAQLIGIEAVHNIAKHARASWARVAVERDGRGHALVIEDDGVGLDHDDSGPGLGMGLQGMRARAAEVGAEIEIAPRRGGGTRVRLRLPRRRRVLA